jgi:hypothetical protein
VGKAVEKFADEVMARWKWEVLPYDPDEKQTSPMVKE